jgi:asparagine synthase (glutamine-hydrolysing)
VPFILNRQVAPKALAEYFSFQFTISGESLIEGVNEVPAAHFGFIDENLNIIVERYWEVHYEIDPYHTEQYFVERLKELMTDSVRMHLRSDVEVGSYVSGGLDSSLLAILSNKIQGGNGFKIFNGRFAEGESFDESRFALDVARDNGMDCFVEDITEDDFVDNLPGVIWHLDGPVAGPGSFPQFMVSKLAAKHVKVVLGGQGGDEIFGGYARYLIAYFEQCIKGAIDGNSHAGNFVVTYESIIQNLETLKEYKPLLREFWSTGLFGPRDERYFQLINRSNSLTTLISPEIFTSDKVYESFQSIFHGSNILSESYFDQMTHFDFKTLLPALLQVEDRMSMAHGLESRVPFLDHPLVEFAATIPPTIKFSNGELKRLLKNAFLTQLPESIQKRKDKMGFPVPLNGWLKSKGSAYDFVVDTLGSSRARSRSYLKPGINLSALLESSGTFNRNIWALLSLELWQQQFIDG